MSTIDFEELFTEKNLRRLMPSEKSDEFFEAMYGDSDEGAYDISLRYNKYDENNNTLGFELQLKERPGKCLACNLTYGLPEVFSRHPLINLNGVVSEICQMLGDAASCDDWILGSTQPVSKDLHAIPLQITLK